MNTRKPLTQRQRMVYARLCQYWDEHGHGPSYRDLCASTGIHSTNGVKGHIEALVTKGWASRPKGLARAVRPVSNSSIERSAQ